MLKTQTFKMPPYKRNDVVQVISGKYKGRSGKILRILADKNMVVVEKVNMIKRHMKPSQSDPKGGIVEKEAPLYVSKVLPVSAKTGKPVRIAKWLREEGREAKKTKAPKAQKARGKK